MAAVAEGLTVAIVRVRTDQRRKVPMLIIGCTDPRHYPPSKEVFHRLKRAVASTHGVDETNLQELEFDHPSFKAVRIPLLGLLFEEFDHLANTAHCRLISKTRQAIGLSRPAAEQLSVVIGSLHDPEPRVVKRAPSMVH